MPVTLVPITPDLVAAVDDPEAFQRTAGADLGENVELFRSLVAQGEAHRLRTGGSFDWGGFLAVTDDGAARRGVGTCAFVAAPDARGEVEIAYGTFPDHEGQGFGGAMAGALLAHAATSGAVRVVYAHTLPMPGASTRILQRHGFVRNGTAIDPDEGEVWRWERPVDGTISDGAQRLGSADDDGAAAAPDDLEIATARVLDAPRERVFGAIAEPDELARWWGPRGFTNTFETFDFRPGGEWRFVMHAPDGAEFPNHSVFVEIARPERVVLDHVSAPRFRLVIALADDGGRTRIDWRMRFGTPAERDRVARYATEANEQNLDRLEAQVAEPR